MISRSGGAGHVHKVVAAPLPRDMVGVEASRVTRAPLRGDKRGKLFMCRVAVS